jgi:hypothetical protein
LSVRSAIVAILAANPAVAAIAGDRIRPMNLGQEDAKPAIVVRGSERPWTTLEDEIPATGEATVQIQCIAEGDDGTTSRLADAVRSALRQGRSGDDREIIGIWEDILDPTIEPSEEGTDSQNWYYEIVAFTVHWKRVDP